MIRRGLKGRPEADDDWRRLPFSDAVLLNPRIALDRGAIYPFVDMAAVSPGSRDVVASQRRKYSGGGSRFCTGDTLMARITPCLENGKIARYRGADASDPAHGSTEFIVVRGRLGVTDPEYAYYLTCWDEVHDYAVGQMTGTSGRQRVATDSLAHLVVPVPSMGQQRAIVHVVGTLDDKIELNRRMAETLEGAVRTLFKSWFTRRCGDSGCERTLADIALLNPESWTPATAPGTVAYVDLSNTKWGIIEKIETYAWRDAPIRAKRVLRPGDTIVGTVRPGNGSYALVGVEGLTGSTGFAVLRPKEHFDAVFVWCAATSKSNIGRLAQLADGGAYPAVSPQAVAATKITLADVATRKEFSDLATPQAERMLAAYGEANQLAELRDTLLPKLISGEIRIQDAEKLAEAAT